MSGAQLPPGEYTVRPTDDSLRVFEVVSGPFAGRRVVDVLPERLQWARSGRVIEVTHENLGKHDEQWTAIDVDLYDGPESPAIGVSSFSASDAVAQLYDSLDVTV